MPTKVDLENPFKAIRLANSLTQVEIAKAAGITKHAVIRNEQAMAPEPIPKLLNYFTRNFPVSQQELMAGYTAFQLSCRESAGLLLGSLEIGCNKWRVAFGGKEYVPHPLTFLRQINAYNPTSFAKALCLSQSVVVYFENNPINQQTVPEQVLFALKDAGYNNDSLLIFKKAYDRYREWAIASQKMRVGL